VQGGELVARSLGKNFHASIVIVANPSCDPEDVGLALHKPAEADALHPTAHNEAASFNRFFRESHLRKMLLEKVQALRGISIDTSEEGCPAPVILKVE
jgi:hypothetical protein